MAKENPTKYGWKDLLDLEDCALFYADLNARGFDHRYISEALDEFFPKIILDKMLLTRIRQAAFKLVKKLAGNTDLVIERQQSIQRLKRVCANPHAKGSDIIKADHELAERLRLNDKDDESTASKAEALAEKMREFLAGAMFATNGTAAAAEKAAESDKKDKDRPGCESEETEETPAAKIKKEKIAAKLLAKENKELEKVLGIARAKRLKSEMAALKKQGVKEDKVDHSTWEHGDS